MYARYGLDEVNGAAMRGRVSFSEEELARRKKAATGYDGAPLEKGDRARLEMMQSVNVEEQIKAIHQKFGEKK